MNHYTKTKTKAALGLEGLGCGFLCGSDYHVEFAELGGEVASVALEELDEIGGVVVAEVEGDFLDHEVGVAHHSLRLEDDAVVDEREGGHGGAFVDALVEGTDSDIQTISIFLDSVDAGEVLLHQSAEIDEELMGWLEHVQLELAIVDTVTEHLHEEDTEERVQDVDIAEGVSHGDFLLDGMDNAFEFLDIFLVDRIARSGVEGVEHIIFKKAVALVAHEVSAHLQAVAFIAGAFVEVMYLTWGEEENGVRFDFVLMEVDGMHAGAFLEPQYLVERMDMWGAIVKISSGEEIGHVLYFKDLAARH